MSTFEPRGEHAHHYISSRVRRFTVTSNDYETLTFSGVDVTPEEVMRHRQKALTTAWEAKHCPTGNELHRLIDGWGSEALWEGSSVVAVLIPRVAADMRGPALNAHRFDNIILGRKPGRLWHWNDETEYGDDDDGGDDAADD